MFLKPKRAASILDFASLGDEVDSALSSGQWKRTKPGPRPSPWNDAMIAALVELEKHRRGISGRETCKQLSEDPRYRDLLEFLLPVRPRNRISDSTLRYRAGIGEKGERVQLEKREHGDAWPAALIEQLIG